MMRNVYIGLGSNLGDRFRTINSAIADIERELVESRSIKSLTTSNIYETEAWGMDDGTPPFLNCVVCVETDLDLSKLLDVLLKVEIDHGRCRVEGEGYASRTLDCDILLAGDEVVQSERLQVPHPRISSRRFVLQPLCDLDPNLNIPYVDSTVSQLLSNCSAEPKVVQWDHTHT
ncbi:MAG: 2-amino-4-hydroxy-6-hydroxymethyldihydropteridine diphosphokinase [Euryarchaeota archaeon]|nr:2-amino-4-hydroxy-6-hydroxymethyldihydropteridine diphosphokinase [Euryarchaeota archaeon]|tara:strand:+ start:78 stop:599 length:522 start_codon:yes stop_codon:yes gene_type:complete